MLTLVRFSFKMNNTLNTLKYTAIPFFYIILENIMAQMLSNKVRIFIKLVKEHARAK